MSEYLNAKYIHIATEVLYGCMLTYFVYSRNKQLSQHIQLLESKLMRYEQLLQEHDNILQTLLRKHGEVVPSKQTQQTLNKKILLEQKLNQGTPPSSVSTPTLILSPTAHSEPKPQPSNPVVHTPYFYEEPLEEDNIDTEVIETQGGYEENLDEEIQKELDRLKSIKQGDTTEKTN